MSHSLTELSFERTGTARSRWHAPARAVDLLRRYPDLDEHELSRLTDIFQRTPALEIALMMVDPDVGPRLEAFCNDHRPWLRIPPGNRVAIAMAMVGMVLLLCAAAFAA